MRLKLPHTLHYPITVTGLLVQPNESVARAGPLFSYSYQAPTTGTNEDGTTFDYQHNYSTRFESSVDGTLQKWFLRKGDVIPAGGREVAEIDEPCTHSVQFGGMCVTCGKDMTQLSYASTVVDASRANINMIHDNTALTVSQDEATRIETEAKRRLIAARKLSLVVDLDQTIIHATVDPTVAEWQSDPNNPNHDAVKDVQSFQLIDDGPGGRGTWYYIKLRPGLKEFLENVSQVYELHIYTMGTRAYAQHIANLVDPKRRIFGDRILSRDESGSMVAKNLQRLFPVDTKMVVIIDDRGDVWNWNPNLIKVTQFSFFIGIGDINSSFLPKRPRAPTVSKDADKAASESTSTPESTAPTEKAASSSTAPSTPPQTSETTIEQLVSMGGGDDPNVLQEQNAKQDEVLKEQLEERPLLQKQKELDAAESSEADEEPRHHLLNDDDNELYFLERSLKRVHAAFFDAYTKSAADASGGRLAELRGAGGSGKRKAPSQDVDLEVIPDIKSVMPTVKAKVLAGVTIVFSGVIPLGTDSNSAEIVIWARSFGARISDTVSRRHTTHVVAARNRTAKVRQAVRKGHGAIKVVSLHWLMDCIVQWARLDERPYLLSTDEADLGKPFPDEADDEELLSQSDSHSASGDEDTDAEPPPPRPGLSVRTSAAALAATDTDTDDEELAQHSPTGTGAGSGVTAANVDWGEMDEELKEFLGSDEDEDEDEDADADNDDFDLDSRPPGAIAGIVPNGTSDRLHPATAKRSHADITGSDSETSSVGSARSRRSKSNGTAAPTAGGAAADRGTRSPSRKKRSALSRTTSRNGGPEPGNDVDEEEEEGWSDGDEADLEAELMAGADDDDED